MHYAVIAECYHHYRRGQGEKEGAASARGDQEASVRVCLSGGMRCERWRGAPLLVGGGGCQLFDLSAFRLVDLLGSRKVGELAGRGGFLVYPGGKASAAVVWLVCRWVVAGQETEDAAGGLAALRVLASVPPLLGGGGLPAGQGRRKERRALAGW